MLRRVIRRDHRFPTLSPETPAVAASLGGDVIRYSADEFPPVYPDGCGALYRRSDCSRPETPPVAVRNSDRYIHPRMQEFELSDIKEMRELSYYHDVRLNIWGAALQQPQDYIAYGLGAGQSGNYLKDKYQAVHFDGYVAKQYHAHCQYLEEAMEIGLPGLLFFLLAWLSIPVCTSKKGRQTALLFTFLFILNMFTDCVFGKFDGVALWAVGLLFILLQSDPQREEQPAGDTERH